MRELSLRSALLKEERGGRERLLTETSLALGGGKKRRERKTVEFFYEREIRSIY